MENPRHDDMAQNSAKDSMRLANISKLTIKACVIQIVAPIAALLATLFVIFVLVVITSSMNDSWGKQRADTLNRENANEFVEYYYTPTAGNKISSAKNILQTVALVGVIAIAGVQGYRFKRAKDDPVNVILENYGCDSNNPLVSGRVVNLTNELCHSANMYVPEIFATSMTQFNAFSLRDNQRAAIVIDEELISALEDDELKCVIAHELAHLYSNDSLAITQLIAVVASLSKSCQMGQVSKKSNCYNSGKQVYVEKNARFKTRRELVGRIYMFIATNMLKYIIPEMKSSICSGDRDSYADNFAIRLVGNSGALASAFDKISNAIHKDKYKESLDAQFIDLKYDVTALIGFTFNDGDVTHINQRKKDAAKYAAFDSHYNEVNS